MPAKKRIEKLPPAQVATGTVTVAQPLIDSFAVIEIATNCLDKMAELLQAGWSRITNCTDDEGKIYHYASPHVTRFDLYGALYKSTRNLKLAIVDKERVEALLWRVLRDNVPTPHSIVTYSRECPNLAELLQMIQTARAELNPAPKPVPIPKERKRI